MNEKNKNKLLYLNAFCHLYRLHRDFMLAKQIARHNIRWECAEKIADLCNFITNNLNDVKPQDFMKCEDDRANEAIEAYTKLKHCLNVLKFVKGVKYRDSLYKDVKMIYKSRVLAFALDTWFPFLIHDLITFGVSGAKMTTFDLFTGKQKPIDKKVAFFTANKIISCSQTPLG
jgi:hypothetical protein